MAPADDHNTTGQFNPAVHGFNGINPVSLSGYPRGTDNHVIQTTTELSDEFPFNLDYNSGYQLGVGENYCYVFNRFLAEAENRQDGHRPPLEMELEAAHRHPILRLSISNGQICMF